VDMANISHVLFISKYNSFLKTKVFYLSQH
jgi:hypothetical protein